MSTSQQTGPRPHPRTVLDHHGPHHRRPPAPEGVLGREGPIAHHHLVAQQTSLANGDRLSGAQHRLGPDQGTGPDAHFTGSDHGAPIPQPRPGPENEPSTTPQPKPNPPPDSGPLPQRDPPAAPQAQADEPKANAQRNAAAVSQPSGKIARRRRRPGHPHHSRPKHVSATNRPGLPLGCNGNASSPLTAHSSV